MTNINFIKFNKETHRGLLAEFLESQEWPSHVNSIVKVEKGSTLINTNTFYKFLSNRMNLWFFKNNTR